MNFDESVDELVNKKEPDRPKISLFSKIQSNETAKRLQSEASQPRNTDPSWKLKSVDVKSVENLVAPVEAITVPRASSAPIKSSDSIPHEHKLCTELQTPKLKPSTADAINVPQKSNTDDETPYKPFQVPQTSAMRRLQTTSQHRTILLSANHPRKCRSDLENEFRSQKVLFTTPSTMSRQAIKGRNNLTDLDDSLNCYKSSPMVNLSPVKEERKKDCMKYASVESMDDLYRSIDKIDGKSADPSNKEMVEVSSTAIVSESDEKQDKKEKTIRINGKDFIVLNKLGQGGSSSVFLVEHKDTKLQCALKVSCVI